MGDSFQIENFKNLQIGFSPVPFWFINIIPDRKTIEFQLNEMEEKGIEGFFIHARMGLEVPEYIPEPEKKKGTGFYEIYFTEKRKKFQTPYLSEEWWRIVEDILEISRKKNMKVWIYDEFDWPSGTAGMKIPKEFPELRTKYLEVSVKKRGKIKFKNPKFVYLIRKNEVINLEGNLNFYKIKKGEKLIIFEEKIYENYVDVLNEKATEKFIEYTHNKYFEKFFQDFGKNILGFFSDEVTLIHHLIWMDFKNLLFKKIIPFSPVLEEEFFKINGYQLKDKIYLLVEEREESAKFKVDFFKTLSLTYAKNFHKKIKDWCEKHNVYYTGHILGEEANILSFISQGNIFEVLRNFHIPGVDHLGKLRLGIHPKIASSVSHFIGSKRTLCEAFGETKKLDIDTLKKITNWLYVSGINFLNPHAFFASIEGFRKYDAPPSQFIQAKFWNQYKKFSDYVKRLSYFSTIGIHNPDIAIYYPLNSIMANFKPSFLNREINFIYNEIFNVYLAISSLLFDFDFCDEEMLKEAIFENGKMKIRDEEYKCLVLPSVSYLTKEIMEKIKEAFEKNLKIVFTSTLPLKGIDISDREVKEFSKELFKEEFGFFKKPVYHLISIDTILPHFSFLGFGEEIDIFVKNLIKFLDRFSFSSPQLIKNKNSFFLKTYSGFKPYGKHFKILQNILSDIERDFEVEPDVRFLQIFKRKTEKENFYLLLNNSFKDVKVKIKFKNFGKVVIFENGEVKELNSEENFILKNTNILGFIIKREEEK
jgi:hypothetical protein